MVGRWNMKPVYAQALVYADNIVLISDTENKLQTAMTEWTETLSERGMRVNMKKSQVMMVARTEEQVKPIKIMSAGKELMQVESYNYLGTQIHQTGKLQPEIRNRVQKATSAYFSINNIIFGKKEIERKTKTRVQKNI